MSLVLGPAYCESCIALPTNEMIRCHVCQIKHPGKAPKVCLELDDFLEEQLPIEYAKRRTSFQLKQDHLQQESSTTCMQQYDILLCSFIATFCFIYCYFSLEFIIFSSTNLNTCSNTFWRNPLSSLCHDLLVP